MRMRVLYVHKNFPAQFGHVAERLVERNGFRCWYVTEQTAANTQRVETITYKCAGGAERATHVASRGFENSTWRSHAVLISLLQRADIRPDVIVGHSGFGSTLFLRDFYDAPIVNLCEWFYRWHGSDTELLGHRGDANGMNRLTDRCRDAMLLADLDACTLAYSPTNWQRSRIPYEYQYKLDTIFDGIDTTFWRPLSKRERRFGRWVAGKWIPWRKKVITYVARGFESIRGFDIFMQIAQRICENRKDVVFLCIGSDRVCYGGDLKYVPEKSFREHVLKRGNYDLDRFIFTGPVPPDELRRAFAYSDLHIYLTVPFILSWSLMDALACGCTVLVADTPPLREVIEHGDNGLMAAYFDVDHFVELALEVLDDPAAYRRKLGQAGLETIHEKYDLDVVLPKMINLYERAINGEVGRPSPADPNARQAPIHQPIRLNGKATSPADPNARKTLALQPIRLNGKPNAPRGQPGTADLLGWLSTAEVEALRELIPNDAKLILELGAWRGQTTRSLADTFPQATVIAVDTWHGGQYREPEHPEWKAMLPDVWDSFAARIGDLLSTQPVVAEAGNRLDRPEAGSFGYGRVIPMHRRHDDAVREVASAGLAPDVIYFDPDYNTRLIRETLAAIVRSFPHTPLIGHDWLWHRVQREVSQASRQTGRRLDSRGNFWFLAPAGRNLHAEREGYTGPSKNGNGKWVPGVEPIGEPPVRAAGGSAWLRPQAPIHHPLRVLVTVPHFYRARSSRLYGSGIDTRERRIEAVRSCLRALLETWGSEAYAANLTRPENLPANASTEVQLHVLMCVSGKDHLLDALELPDGSFETRSVRGDPLFLGYACHEVLRDRLGQYDYYAYMEDDLVLTDPWAFTKLRWFTQMVGEECLLQPNRFELADCRTDWQSVPRGRDACRKAYIDGDLPPDKTARYQDVSQNPVLNGRFLGSPVTFRRTTNPHAGCFFLTERQLRLWSEQPYFLDRDATFYSPLEGAATVGIMRAFRTYKPVRENANFFEIRHVGDTWMRKLAERDGAATPANRRFRRGGQAQFAPETSAN